MKYPNAFYTLAEIFASIGGIIVFHSCNIKEKQKMNLNTENQVYKVTLLTKLLDPEESSRLLAKLELKRFAFVDVKENGRFTEFIISKKSG